MMTCKAGVQPMLLVITEKYTESVITVESGPNICRIKYLSTYNVCIISLTSGNFGIHRMITFLFSCFRL